MIRLLKSMSNQSSIVVSSRTFSNTPVLVDELRKHFSNIKFNEEHKLSSAELADFIGNAKGVIVGLETINNQVLDRCPNLEIIAKYGVGLDNIDLEACARRGIQIGWTGGTNRLSVAEMTIGFMLMLSRNLSKTSIELKRGVWDKDGGFQLSGRNVGIIGVGNTGKEVIRLLKPFGCRIFVNDIIDQRDYYQTEGVEEVTKEEIFTHADIISLHVPLTPSTRRMINKTVLASMRPNAYIINTARGQLVDYQALKEALRSKIIAGVATDVYEEEPPTDTELLSFDNVICTPHIGGNSKEAVLAMGVSAIEHLRRHFIV